MTEKISVTPTTQQTSVASTQVPNQSSAMSSATDNTQLAKTQREKDKKNDGVMGWCKRNWGWLLAGVVAIGAGVYFLVRKHNKDKDKKKAQSNKDKKFDSQENVDKMFILADTSDKSIKNNKGNDTNSSIYVRQKDGSYVYLNKNGTYKSTEYNIVGQRQYYDMNQNAYVTSSATLDAYKTKTSYTPNGNIQFTSSSTIDGTVSITYDSTGSKVLSETRTPANVKNNGTLANSGQLYTDGNNVNINNNDYSR